ncbi:sulfite exporter TauE/SafE family protein [Vibrio caribbeanicus]|uniref:sulfite exporter TauE/SafE family protein n=1 Tax=Vibrio caribbeanicus TaxID=701175 RepID=UPI0022850CF4|nr:sulfite exporter TauE/SafE family protein [Vibrio caribbeanicus]MCY9845312.1 sulfite exporter TauE/SafE family protein [Vibrio caribbeanicus]
MEWVLLFFSGLLAGVLNSIAGGGSFITFPALLFVGLPPVVANATNTFSSCAGYVSGAAGFYQELKEIRHFLPMVVLYSTLGGALGAISLLFIPSAHFEALIPWLMLFATSLFILGERVNRALNDRISRRLKEEPWFRYLSVFLLFLIALYGGFFNAGLGIVILGYLVLTGFSDVHQMNGLKLLISAIVSMTAIVIFIYDGLIDWSSGAAVMLGTLIGGFIAARISRRIDAAHVRVGIIITSISLTVYFFYSTY